MANQLPQVNSTPLDAFLVCNLLVFLPLLAIQEAVSKDQSLTCVNYLFMHQIRVYVSVCKAEIATLTSLLIASTSGKAGWLKEKKTSKISFGAIKKWEFPRQLGQNKHGKVADNTKLHTV